MSEMLSKFIAVGNKIELQAVKRVRVERKRYDSQGVSEAEEIWDEETAEQPDDAGNADMASEDDIATETGKEPGNVTDRIGEDTDSADKIYISKVFDIISDERISILMPMEKTKLILLPVDGEYDLCFYTTHGLYQCFARVTDRYKDNNVFVLILDLTSNLRKYQRRQYYRFSCALNMDSRPLKEEEISAAEREHKLLEPGLPLKRSIIVDISGGGLRFVSDYRYEEKSMILCRYNLIIADRDKQYDLVAQVLSVHELDNRPGVFEHRVQYVNMDVDDREEIIRYIFDEERKSRHKHSAVQDTGR
jgi:c-di-GMP-binding flagellar brake protein YcgR